MDFYLNKKANERMHVNLLLLSCLHAKPRKVVVTLSWTVAGQTTKLTHPYYHARVEDEWEYRSVSNPSLCGSTMLERQFKFSPSPAALSSERRRLCILA